MSGKIGLPDRCDDDIHQIPSMRPEIAAGRRILVVDDNPDVRATLAEVLELGDFETMQAGDAIEALMVLRYNPDIGLLLTDLTMPGADGVTLIRHARGIRPGLPAILLTGYAEQVADASAVAAGNFHILSKPVEGNRLIREVGLLLG